MSISPCCTIQRNGHVTEPELRRMLGFETREALDYTLDDLEQKRRDLRRVGF